MFFSLKLHKLPYLNLFICFNNILKKISFSCYIKCNTSHCNEKVYISLRKRIFQCFFLSFPCFEWKWRKKQQIYYFFMAIYFFFSQNCINYPVSSVSWRINILSKKDHLYFNWEKWIYAISRKKFLFTEKVNFLMIFLLISLFSSNNKQKTLNIATIYFFSEKNNKWRVFQRF